MIDANGVFRRVDAAKVDDIGKWATIPAALGGGVLFVGFHTVRYAASFDAPLLRIAERQSIVVGVGHRTLLVDEYRRAGEAASAPSRMFDLPSGKEIPVAPKGAIRMLGTPKGVVAAIDEKGALYTSQGGGPWQERMTAPKALKLRYDGDDLLVETEAEGRQVRSDGRVIPTPPGMAGRGEESTLRAFADPFLKSNELPPPPKDLVRLVEQGTSTADGTLFTVDGDRLVLRDGTGAPLPTGTTVLHGLQNCFPIRGGAPAFIGCHTDPTDQRRGMTLFLLERPRAPLVEEGLFPNVYAQHFGDPPDEGGLVFGRKCNGEVKWGSFCVRKGDRFVDVTMPPIQGGGYVSGDSLDYVVSSREGDVYGFKTIDGGDLLVLDAARGKLRRFAKSSFPRLAPARPGWGQEVSSFYMRHTSITVVGGTIRFVLARGGVLVITQDDKLIVEPLEGQIAAVHERALQVLPDGRLRETLDAGQTFHDAEPPPGGLPPAPESDHPDVQLRLGCWRVGCAIGPWYRVGWSRR